MAYQKKHSDQEIVEAYERHKNVWAVAREFGDMCGQSVWERAVKLGLINAETTNKGKKFKDYEVLAAEYHEAVKKDGGLDELASRLGRTKQFICRKAKEVGLTNPSRSKNDAQKKTIGENSRKYIKENGHPKGMLGNSHSDEFKKAISERFKAMWADPSSKLNSNDHRQILSDRMMKYVAQNPQSNPYSRAKSGKVTIDGRTIHMRSAWEANVAAYLQFLKENAQIKNWEYEVDTFWFEKIKRGVRSYKPDFKVHNNDDSFYYIEVKGWMDAKSKTKLNRMRIYYPKIKIEVIEKSRYKEICKQKALFKYWGQLD